MKRKVLLSACMAIAGVSGLANAEEALKYPTGLIVPPDATLGVPYFSYDVDTNFDDLPDHYDLRELGLVSPVKNQGQCGSCWAFAGVAVMESAQAKLTSTEANLDLSEQELVSCDNSQYGCGGGWQPFDYMIKNGLSDEATFPYYARNTRCQSRSPVVHASDWGNVGQSRRRATVDEVRKALIDHGALWITVSAGGGWNSPGEVKTSCRNGQTNHAVTVVGYEPDGNGSYNFIIKNSWGESWNGDGYVKMHLGCDNLGETVSFVVPAESECAPPKFGFGKDITVPASGLTLPQLASTPDASFEWLRDGKYVSTGASLTGDKVTDGVYTVRAHTSCGVWEQQVRVHTAK